MPVAGCKDLHRRAQAHPAPVTQAPDLITRRLSNLSYAPFSMAAVGATGCGRVSISSMQSHLPSPGRDKEELAVAVVGGRLLDPPVTRHAVDIQEAQARSCN